VTGRSPSGDVDESVPVSVRLGEVVPPDDPEDWRRPLTWVAAGGMLLGPLVAFGWFALAAPGGTAPTIGTRLLAVALVAGAAAAGSTQLQPFRAAAGTVAAGLFAALGVVVAGVVLAGERQIEAASPTLVHAVVATAAGLTGALAAATFAAPMVRAQSRWLRWLVPTLVGSVAAIVVVQLAA
jgi:hypothetical protein